MISNTKNITRKRVNKSCKHCYSHKLKCDKLNPCSSYIGLDNITEYIYGFSKDEKVDKQNDNKVLKRNFFENQEVVQKVYKQTVNTQVLKSRYYNPFFSSSINENILSSDFNIDINISNKFRRYELQDFNRFPKLSIDIDDII